MALRFRGAFLLSCFPIFTNNCHRLRFKFNGIILAVLFYEVQGTAKPPIMINEGPIVVVDDDEDDQELMQLAIKDLEISNSLIFFTKTADAFEYLRTTRDKPLVIFSDVNLPGQSGVEFKRQIDDQPELREKSIPFVFFSTYIERKTVDIAYKELTIQGYFKKNNSYQEFKNTVKLIIDYWCICQHPNSFT